MRVPAVSVLTAAVVVLVAVPAWPQMSGHNLKGDFGLMAGSQPAPGFYVSPMLLAYNTDTLRNRNGDAISLDPEHRSSLDARVYVLALTYVANFKLLGADVGFMAAPAFANNNLEIPILGFESRTDTGLADLYVRPLVLGWHAPRADFTVGVGFFAPIGRYEPGAKDNVGLGMWSYEVAAGATLFFDDKKSWNLATTAF